MTRSEWTSLSDGELKDRLWHHMNDDPFALPLCQILVEDREDSDAASEIDRILSS